VQANSGWVLAAEAAEETVEDATEEDTMEERFVQTTVKLLLRGFDAYNRNVRYRSVDIVFRTVKELGAQRYILTFTWFHEVPIDTSCFVVGACLLDSTASFANVFSIRTLSSERKQRQPWRSSGLQTTYATRKWVRMLSKRCGMRKSLSGIVSEMTPMRECAKCVSVSNLLNLFRGEFGWLSCATSV
jgi:hypothetical protein